MSAQVQKTKYPGVTFIEVERPTGGTERSYYVTYRTPDGKLKNVSVGRAIRDDMTPAKAAGLRADFIEGKRQTRKEQQEEAKAKPTIRNIWEAYQEEIHNQRTLATDKSNYKYLESLFSAMAPDEIVTHNVDSLRINLTKLGKAPQTVKHIIGLLRRIILYGVKKGYCPLPAPSKLHFQLPKLDNAKTENLTETQVHDLLRALDEDEDQNLARMMKLALFTGMRKSALTGLEWRDVDFDRGFITLRGENAKKGKTEAIPMNTQARAILQSFSPQPGSPYVFPGKNGGRRIELNNFFKRIKEKANLPEGFRPLHGLRHTYASWLASSGQVDLYTLQKLLTHNSPEMTARYAHLADAAMQRAATVAASVFGTMPDSGESNE